MTAVETSLLRASSRVSASAFAEVRRRMVLDHCKWDPHVGDVSTLAPFAVVLSRGEWKNLQRIAEDLAAETVAAEAEIVRRPELWRDLDLPRPLRKVFLGRSLTPGAPRCMRFDFHPTADGWRLSEVNSDVPGGYAEASHFSRLMAERVESGTLEAAGNPLRAWMSAVARAAKFGRVALVCAPGYMEDLQILACLAAELAEHGCDPRIVNVCDLSWRAQRATIRGESVNAIVRFYQAEWLADMGRRAAWRPLFANGKTPVANPPAAVFTESKGFPLVWDRLKTSVAAWRECLPETVDPRRIPRLKLDQWVLKSKYGNNGDDVFFPERMEAKAARALRRQLWWRPNEWVAQRRFASLPLDTACGSFHPCLGVYVVEGRAAGIYGRLSHGPIVDYAAMDAAVLIEGEMP